jgi:hypothetical protein
MLRQKAELPIADWRLAIGDCRLGIENAGGGPFRVLPALGMEIDNRLFRQSAIENRKSAIILRATQSALPDSRPR